MIALSGVRVEAGATTILDGVDLEVPAGTWTTLVGPNGAGKTTLLRATAGLRRAGGELRVAGVDPQRVPERRRAALVASVAQQPVLPVDMTVAEYVLLGRIPHASRFGRLGAADRRVADEELARLDLAALAERRIGGLSGGERQRAVLARALAQRAPVLLLDEATASLDVGRQQQVLDLVAELRAERELTVLGAMHDLTLAGQYGDRVAMLAAGRVVAAGPAAEVLTPERIAAVYGARVRVAVVDGMPVVTPVARAAGLPDGGARV